MKTIKLLTLALTLAALTACNNGGNSSSSSAHVHNFDRQIMTEQYLCSAATCTEAAKYYFSCSCGEHGDKTFNYGEALGHTYDFKGYCSVCQNDYGVEVNTTTTFGASNKENKYYHFDAMAGSYKITYIGDPQKISVYDASETEVCNAMDTEFTTEAATYYIVVYKSETNSGALTLVNTGHVHTYNYKGECTVEGCDNSILSEMPSWDSKRYPNTSNKYYCYTCVMPAGKYQFKYESNKPTLISFVDESENSLVSDFFTTFTITADNTRVYILLHTTNYFTNSVYLAAVTE